MLNFIMQTGPTFLVCLTKGFPLQLQHWHLGLVWINKIKPPKQACIVCLNIALYKDEKG